MRFGFVIPTLLMMTAPALAETCRFKGLPEADFRATKSREFVPLTSKAAYTFAGSAGSGLGLIYNADLPKGRKLIMVRGPKTYAYIDGLEPRVSHPGTCR